VASEEAVGAGSGAVVVVGDAAREEGVHAVAAAPARVRVRVVAVRVGMVHPRCGRRAPRASAASRAALGWARPGLAPRARSLAILVALGSRVAERSERADAAADAATERTTGEPGKRASEKALFRHERARGTLAKGAHGMAASLLLLKDNDQVSSAVLAATTSGRLGD